jgi:hypothetical protein
MFTITATKTAARNGAGNIVAKGHGRQKTTRWDHSLSVDANLASGAGALLNLLTTPQQQAKVRHPSGAQRVRVERLSDAGGRQRFNIDV